MNGFAWLSWWVAFHYDQPCVTIDNDNLTGTGVVGDRFCAVGSGPSSAESSKGK